MLEHSLSTLKPYDKAKHSLIQLLVGWTNFNLWHKNPTETFISTAIILKLSCVKDRRTHCSRCQSREGSSIRQGMYSNMDQNRKQLTVTSLFIYRNGKSRTSCSHWNCHKLDKADMTLPPSQEWFGSCTSLAESQPQWVAVLPDATAHYSIHRHLSLE